MIHEMDFHDFPTIYSVLKQNRLVDEPPDRFYAGALALLRLAVDRKPGQVGVRNGPRDGWRSHER